MFTITQYVTAKSLEEAYALLNANKTNKILGGTLWMRMGEQKIYTAIDLNGLGLDQITENETYIEIGAMCSLRTLETHSLTMEAFDGLLASCVKNIVGVQFRNSATVGGSIYSKFGFSDLLTAFLALDTYVELYDAGLMTLEEFIKRPYKKDILVKILVKKEDARGIYMTERLSHTDFPVLAVAVTKGQAGYKISVGARPSKAVLAYEAMELLNKKGKNQLNKDEIAEVANQVATTLQFGTNMRATAAFRKHLAEILVKRCLKTLND